MDRTEIIRVLKSSNRRAVETRAAVSMILATGVIENSERALSTGRTSSQQSEIVRKALESISPRLSKSYAQAVLDLQDESRISWAGTAHEIREVLSQLLKELAPDELVESAKWYKAETGTTGPTQRQRARFILESHGAGSKEKEVLDKIDVLEDKIGALMRSAYSRASDAAHRGKERSEAYRLCLYFEAFAFDLLDLSID